MAKLKKDFKFVDNILTVVNNFYNNLFYSVDKYYYVPMDIKNFNDKHKKISDKDELEEFSKIIDNNKHKWETVGDIDLIIPFYITDFFINVCNVINSINKNLERQSLGKDIIKTTDGIDIVATTSMQILAVFMEELSKSYKDYELINDKQNDFTQCNKNIEQILNQNPQDAFSNLIENMLLFNQTYKQLQVKISKLKNDDPYFNQKNQLFIKYTNGYIINSLCLILMLDYPYENGLMNNEAHKKLLPNLNLF